MSFSVDDSDEVPAISAHVLVKSWPHRKPSSQENGMNAIKFKPFPDRSISPSNSVRQVLKNTSLSLIPGQLVSSSDAGNATVGFKRCISLRAGSQSECTVLREIRIENPRRRIFVMAILETSIGGRFLFNERRVGLAVLKPCWYLSFCSSLLMRNSPPKALLR